MAQHNATSSMEPDKGSKSEQRQTKSKMQMAGERGDTVQAYAGAMTTAGERLHGEGQGAYLVVSSLNSQRDALKERFAGKVFGQAGRKGQQKKLDCLAKLLNEEASATRKRDDGGWG